MQITILGKSPSWQDAGGACSGYLLEGAETKLLIDCGSGVFGKLRERIDYAEIDAIVISHFHGDHCLDLMPYAYALTYSPRWTPVNPAPRPKLFVPTGGGEVLRKIAGTFGPPDAIVDAFEVSEYGPDDAAQAGDLKLRFCLVPHFIPTFAISATAAGEEGRFTFGADCGPNHELIDFAQGSDLLLIESTLRAGDDAEPRGHLTPAEAGEHGRAANVGQLVLTHIPDELDQALSVAEAAEAFGGEVTLASEGAVFHC
jgi:ribonuclease BN (tRNA processing enzyme)